MLQEPDAWSLPDEDYRFSLGIRPGIPRTFFGPSPDRDRLLAERRHWLTTDSSRYAAILPSAEACLAEVENACFGMGIRCGGSRQQCVRTSAGSGTADRTGSRDSGPGCLRAVGRRRRLRLLSFVLAIDGQDGITGGIGPWSSTAVECVSGSSIHRYLTQMKPGGCWFRTNWGWPADLI